MCTLKVCLQGVCDCENKPGKEITDNLLQTREHSCHVPSRQCPWQCRQGRNPFSFHPIHCLACVGVRWQSGKERCSKNTGVHERDVCARHQSQSGVCGNAAQRTLVCVARLCGLECCVSQNIPVCRNMVVSVVTGILYNRFTSLKSCSQIHAILQRPSVRASLPLPLSRSPSLSLSLSLSLSFFLSLTLSLSAAAVSTSLHIFELTRLSPRMCPSSHSEWWPGVSP